MFRHVVPCIIMEIQRPTLSTRLGGCKPNAARLHPQWAIRSMNDANEGEDSASLTSERFVALLAYLPYLSKSRVFLGCSVIIDDKAEADEHASANTVLLNQDNAVVIDWVHIWCGYRMWRAASKNSGSYRKNDNLIQWHGEEAGRGGTKFFSPKLQDTYTMS